MRILVSAFHDPDTERLLEMVCEEIDEALEQGQSVTVDISLPDGTVHQRFVIPAPREDPPPRRRRRKVSRKLPGKVGSAYWWR